MVIKELNTTNYKHAVVELSYDEIRCLSNSLYQICKSEIERISNIIENQEVNI